jgi:hypothetical protein
VRPRLWCCLHCHPSHGALLVLHPASVAVLGCHSGTTFAVACNLEPYQPPSNDIIWAHSRPCSTQATTREGFGSCPSRADCTDCTIVRIIHAGKICLKRVLRPMSDFFVEKDGPFQHHQNHASWRQICITRTVTSMDHADSNNCSREPHSKPWRQAQPRPGYAAMTCVYSYIVPLQLGTQIDVNGLLVCVGLESSLAKLSPNARLLHTSKRNANIRVVAGVDRSAYAW